MPPPGPLPVGTFRIVALRLSAQAQALADEMLGLGEILPEERWDRASPPDLFLLGLHEPYLDGVRAFAGLRATCPAVPVVILSGTLSADYAVELLKHGAADFLSLPPDPQALRRKIERALRPPFRTAFDAPLFAPLADRREPAPGPGQGDPSGRNRRRVFRVPVPASQPLGVAVSLPGGEVRLAADELSVAFEGALGGMRLRGEPALSARMPAIGAEVSAKFYLPDEKAPLPGRIHVVRIGQTDTHVWLGVQYAMDSQRDHDKMQRLWVRFQRGLKDG